MADPGTAAIEIRPDSLIPGNRDFTVFLAVRVVSMLGDTFAVTALPLLVLKSTGSVRQMGALTGAAGASTIAGGLLAGSLVDRKQQRTIMIACDTFRSALFVLIPAWGPAGAPMPVLYAVVVMASVAGGVFQVSFASALTGLVEPAQLTSANGLFQAATATAYVVGPAAAGTVAAVLGPAAAIGVDGASFLLCAVGMLFVHIPRRVPVRPPAPAVAQGARSELLAGVRFLSGQPALRSLLAFTAVTALATGGLINLFIYYVSHVLARSDQSVGLVLSTAAVGAVTAALSAAPLRRRFGFTVCWAGSYAVCGVAVAAIGFTGRLALIMLIAAVYAFGASLGPVCASALRMETTPRDLIGRTSSVFITVQTALASIGAVILTAASGRIGVREVTGVVGAACLAAAALAAATFRQPASGADQPVYPNGARSMRTICTSRINEDNLGDRATSPANYFPWLAEAERVDLWDTDLTTILAPRDPALVIVGGLGVFGWGNGIGPDRYTRTFNYDTNVQALAELQLPNVVLWGVGHESRNLREQEISFPAHLKQFNLVGLRDYLADTDTRMPEGYTWTGCPSSVHPAFDDLSRYADKKHEVVIYDHREHRVDLDDPSIPRLDNFAPSMEQTIDWLGSAETVITTSYHGALWAGFVGAKVIIPNPWATKFLMYRHQPIVIGDVAEWQEARGRASVFDGALAESRQATLAFAERVHDLYDSLSNEQPAVISV